MTGSRLTICHLLFTMHLGGAEVLADRIARRLAGVHRPVFACLEAVGDLGDRLRAEGYSVLDLGKRPGVDVGILAALRAFLRAEAVDVVHAHHCGPFLYAAMARLPGRGPAILMTEHGRPYPDGSRIPRTLANRALLRRHDRLVAVSQSVRQALITYEGFPAARIEVVLNGIDLSAYCPDMPDRAAVRRELGLGPDEFALIQVARLATVKDHPTALDALETLERQRAGSPAVRLILVGDGPEAEAIRARIRDRGLEAQVMPLGTRTDVPRLLQAADAVLLTSRSEGIPLALVEGMATGLPVVATAVGGVPDVVVAGQTGLLAPAGDAAGLAGHVLELVRDPARRAHLGRAGRARAEAVFAEDRMVSDYDRMYRAMAARGRPGGARDRAAPAEARP